MTTASASDHDIRALADRLSDLRDALGDDYWNDRGVRTLQAELRGKIGTYGAWGADKLPMHQRSRMTARYESELAHLLWPR
ncbi:MAG: hypothetical protein EA405_15285 [Rhodospirillales bacterium]|nr:MAG: hypothetical protein EA405_15285 [Rhodospirillales bacterium]